MNLDPSTTKYMIKAKLLADGIVEKPDVVGAIFGQTEGLIGDELDLRDLQKSGRVGRIEVELKSNRGKSEGEITMPTSLDQVETAIMAAALETIDRVGPCKARIEIKSVEDVRATKKNQIIERAKVLLAQMMEDSKSAGIDLMETIRQEVQVQEIVQYGDSKAPAGPNVETSDAIIVVEGRSDVLNLLKYGIKNSIAIEGTNVSVSIQELTKERVVTAFVDGDRGGELILKEMLQTCEVDFVARAPRNREVEELTQKQIIKALRNKIPADQFIDMYGLANGLKKAGGQKQVQQPRESFHKQEKETPPPEPRQMQPPPVKTETKVEAEQASGGTTLRLSEKMLKYRDILTSLTGTHKAQILDDKGNMIKEVQVKDLADTLKKGQKDVHAIVFDGIITQRLLDIASNVNVKKLIGVKLGGLTKQPLNLELWSKAELVL